MGEHRGTWRAVGALAILITACSGDDEAPASATADGGAPSGTSDGGGASGDGASPAPGTCETDPLRTGIVAQQTGVSADAFDCAILTATAASAEPDAMIFKAIIYVESRFDAAAVACPNLPCGMPDGWTDAESRCYGLMQIVPACKGPITAPTLLANGHPSLEKDPASPDWSSSVFNPEVNIRVGIAGIADNRAQVKQKFAGCTEDQYTLMAIGNYNSYGSTKSCTELNQEYVDLVLTTYREYAKAAGYAAHAY